MLLAQSVTCLRSLSTAGLTCLSTFATELPPAGLGETVFRAPSSVSGLGNSTAFGASNRRRLSNAPPQHEVHSKVRGRRRAGNRSGDRRARRRASRWSFQKFPASITSAMFVLRVRLSGIGRSGRMCPMTAVRLMAQPRLWGKTRRASCQAF